MKTKQRNKWLQELLGRWAVLESCFVQRSSSARLLEPCHAMQPAEKDSFWQHHYTVQVPATDSSLSAAQPSMNSPLSYWIEAKVLSHSFLSLESLTYYRNMVCNHLLADLSRWVFMHFIVLRYCTFSRAQILYFRHSIPRGRHYFVGDVPQEQSVLPWVQQWLQS